MACKLPLIFPALALALLASCGQGSRRSAADFQVEQHVRWLASRMAPNRTLPVVHPSRQNLILSYDVPESDAGYPHLHNKSFAYDNALAAIAFASAGDWDRAEKLLVSQSTLVRNDGSLWFNYNLAIDWPSETDAGFALIRTGAVAWTGYAFCYFLENRPGLSREDKIYPMFLNTARKIAGFILSATITRPSDPLYGLVTGGSNTITLTLDTAGRVAEKWFEGPVTWASTEHNIDAHLFLCHLYALTRDPQYRDPAERIAAQTLKVLWSDRDGQFFRGIKGNGVIDSVLALDCAAWAAVFLRNIGRDSLADRCLAVLEQDYRNTYNGLTGYRPYLRTPVYETKEINRFYYPESPGLQWGDFPFLWMEGGYGVLLALEAAGKKDEARAVLKTWFARFSADTLGGIPYSVAEQPVPYQFTLWKSVASTAWHVILAEHLSGKKMKRPFFSRAE